VIGPHIDRGTARRPGRGSLSWGQRMRAAAGRFIVGAGIQFRDSALAHLAPAPVRPGMTAVEHQTDGAPYTGQRYRTAGMI
jgi:hypothetical protein